MTINRSAYQVTATNGFNLKKTLSRLEEAEVNGSVPQAAGWKVRALHGGSPSANEVPHFDHPLYFPGEQGSQGHTVFDARPYGSYDKLQERFTIRNEGDYNLALLRAKLNWIWNAENVVGLRELSTLPMTVYASWLSTTIAHKYTLEGEEQMRLQALAGYFYACLFTDDEEFSEQDLNRTVGQIAKSTNVAADTVFQVAAGLPVLKTLADFCTAAAKVTESVRLAELNPGVLLTLMGGTWQGNTKVEMMGVAMEHPPTWITVLFMAMTSRNYKNSRLGRDVEIWNRQQAGTTFIRAVTSFCADRIGA